MVQLPVAQLVSQNGKDLWIVATFRRLGWAVRWSLLLDVSLDQRVKKDDPFVLEEAVKVGVAVR